MKRFAQYAVVAALAVALVGCGAKASDNTPVEDAGKEPIEEVTELVGGWETSDEASSLLTPEEADIFQMAMGDLLGVSYEPVAVIGRQVVAGTNYAYLCKATTVGPDAKPEWVVAVIYVDLEGNASFTGANPIDLADLHTVDEGSLGQAFGAWEVIATDDFGPIPTEVSEALTALAAEGSHELQPLVVLGSQIVNGTNYQVLCVGHAKADNAPTCVYDATVYVSLEGTAEVTSIEALDLAFYVTPMESAE